MSSSKESKPSVAEDQRWRQRQQGSSGAQEGAPDMGGSKAGSGPGPGSGQAAVSIDLHQLACTNLLQSLLMSALLSHAHAHESGCDAPGLQGLEIAPWTCKYFWRTHADAPGVHDGSKYTAIGYLRSKSKQNRLILAAKYIACATAAV
jgi:hypothetical protein